MSAATLDRPVGRKSRGPRKPRSALRNWFEWGLVALPVNGLRALPAWLSLPLLSGLAWVSYQVAGSRRRQALGNVEAALGHSAGEARAKAIVLGAYRTFAWNVVESQLLVRRLRRQPLEELVTLEGAEHLDRALASGRGVILASAHFGSWEAMAVVVGRRFKPAWAISRHLANPILTRWILRWRQQYIAGTLLKDGSSRLIARLMRQGEMVGPLLDQNAGHGGLLVPFLGQPALQHRLPAVMARRFGAIVIPAYLRREGPPLHYRMVIEAPLEPDPSLEGGRGRPGAGGQGVGLTRAACTAGSRPVVLAPRPLEEGPQGPGRRESAALGRGSCQGGPLTAGPRRVQTEGL